jgi:hypothetical protein
MAVSSASAAAPSASAAVPSASATPPSASAATSAYVESRRAGCAVRSVGRTNERM